MKFVSPGQLCVMTSLGHSQFATSLGRKIIMPYVSARFAYYLIPAGSRKDLAYMFRT